MTENMREADSNRLTRTQVRLLCCLIAIVSSAVLFAHWPALSAKALSFDDSQYLVNNALVRNPSWKNASRFLSEVTKPSTVVGYYQPLTMISLMLDYALGGRPDNLYVFHRTSIALHIVNTGLIIVLLYLLFGDVLASAAVGLLFGVHPMTVEPIPWVGERKTLLAAFFALLCLVFYVLYCKRKSRLSYAACIATYVMAVMSKPTAMGLPLLMVLMDYWPLRRLSLRVVFEKAPLLVIAIASAVITLIGQKQVGGSETGGAGVFGSVLVVCHNIVFYLYKIVYPANLSSHYAFPKVMALSNPMVLAGVVGTCVLIVILAISLRWTRALITGWLFFFLGILPTMQLVKFSNVIASDKFAYLPSLGLLMVLATFLKRLLNYKSKARVVFVLLFVLAAAGLETTATRRYLACWRDTVTLFERMASLTPDSAPVHTTLGNALREAGRIDEAMEQHLLSLKLDPNSADGHNNIGVALGMQGKLDEAIEHFQRSIDINPALTSAHNNFGGALYLKGRFDEAAEQFDYALRLNPDFAEAHNSLGIIRGFQGRIDEAIIHFRKALEIQPDYREASENLQAAKRLKRK